MPPSFYTPQIWTQILLTYLHYDHLITFLFLSLSNQETHRAGRLDPFPLAASLPP